MGKVGPVGETGEVGMAGEKGQKGVIGLPGEEGQKGAAGDDVSVALSRSGKGALVRPSSKYSVAKLCYIAYLCTLRRDQKGVLDSKESKAFQVQRLESC